MRAPINHIPSVYPPGSSLLGRPSAVGCGLSPNRQLTFFSSPACLARMGRPRGAPAKVFAVTTTVTITRAKLAIMVVVNDLVDVSTWQDGPTPLLRRLEKRVGFVARCRSRNCRPSGFDGRQRPDRGAGAGLGRHGGGTGVPNQDGEVRLSGRIGEIPQPNAGRSRHAVHVRPILEQISLR
ncbi:unnamed protein product [Ectocarpus sp. 12 AP-2014]